MKAIGLNEFWKKTFVYFFLLLNFPIFFLNYATAQDDSKKFDPNQKEEVRGEFGNWLEVCEKNTDHCVAVQLALDVEGKQAARVVLERLEKKAENPADSVLTVFIPFESSIPILPNGLSFTVDSNEPFIEQFLFCDQLGCTSQFGITDQGVDLFKNGANLTIQIRDLRDPTSSYIVDVDLDQFEIVYDKLVARKSG